VYQSDAQHSGVHTYCCSRQTRRWPNKLFFNIIDIAGMNSYILWNSSHSEWERQKNCKRRLYLMELSKALMMPRMQTRSTVPTLRTSVRNVMERCGVRREPQNQQPPAQPGQVGRCHLCSVRRQTRTRCTDCSRFVCQNHSRVNTQCDSCQ